MKSFRIVWQGEDSYKVLLDNYTGGEVYHKKEVDREINRIRKSIVHCENCGSDWVDNGINSGCNCLKIKQLENDILKLKTQIVEDNLYCQTCGSCGEPGCCPPDKCKTVQGLYCEENLKSYKEMSDNYDKMEDKINKYKNILLKLKKEINDITINMTEICANINQNSL